MTARYRFVRFNVVGLAGIGVQLATIGVLVHLCGVGYLEATAVGVAAAVLHNFVWHARWTWRDRAPARAGILAAFGRFAGTNGAVSMAGNLGLMPILVGTVGLAPIPANLAAIGACGLVNYWLGGRVCFPQVSTGRGHLWKTDPSP